MNRIVNNNKTKKNWCNPKRILYSRIEKKITISKLSQTKNWKKVIIENTSIDNTKKIEKVEINKVQTKS